MSIPSIAMIPSGYKANKVYSVLPTDGSGDLNFARTTTATRVNQNGLIEEVAIGVPRLDYTNGGCPSLLLEPASTNLYLNSDAIVTQNITTLASSYTVSFYGTGTITFTGTYSGSLIGTGIGNRVSITFTATAGALTSTVSGTVTKGQAENLSYASSYIPTPGTAITRTADSASKSGISSLINSSEGTLFVEMAALDDDLSSRDVFLSDGIGDNFIRIGYTFQSNKIRVTSVSNSIEIYNVYIDLGDITLMKKIALTWSSGSNKIFVNGIELYSNSEISTPIGLNTLSFKSPSNVNFLEAKVKQLQVYKTALSDAELTTLTTP